MPWRFPDSAAVSPNSATIAVLCKACGAPIDSVSDVMFCCRHCGTPDVLPRETHARVRVLRQRLQAQVRSVVQLSTRDATLVHMFEVPTRPYLVPMVACAGLWLLCGPYGGALFACTLVWAVPFELRGAYGRRIYRRKLRGYLVARPPRSAGAPPCCRGCGATLPDEPGPLLCCTHCQTHNIVTAGWAEHAGANLAVATQANDDRRMRASAELVALGRAVDRFMVWLTPAALVLAMLLSGLLQ